MVCATRDIIIFNKYLDSESRRTAYRPTRISGCSVYDRKEISKNGGFHSGQYTYMIRIPLTAKVQAGRTYESAAAYDADENPGEHWTIHAEDFVVVVEGTAEDIANAVFENDIKELAKTAGYQGRAIMIADFSDDTGRGSDRVKHWRIGGV